MAAKAKVLVADVPEMDDIVRSCLPDHELTFVRTMDEAVSALRRDWFHLVAIGLHFDESRMFELLSYVRGLERYHEVPVICIQGLDVMLSESVVRSIDVAVKALGGSAFLDLRQHAAGFERDCGYLDRAAAQSNAPLRPN
jgi:PleD family two-component response regulator